MYVFIEYFLSDFSSRVQSKRTKNYEEISVNISEGALIK